MVVGSGALRGEAGGQFGCGSDQGANHAKALPGALDDNSNARLAFFTHYGHLQRLLDLMVSNALAARLYTRLTWLRSRWRAAPSE